MNAGIDQQTSIQFDLYQQFTDHFRKSHNIQAIYTQQGHLAVHATN